MPPARRLPSSLFSVVMATGIVALAAGQAGLRVPALVLYGLAAIALATCWTLYVLRLLREPRTVAAEMADHQRAPGHFTAVAGTAVVGSGCAVLLGSLPWALALLALTACAWLALTYAILAGVATTDRATDLEAGLGGAWLLVVVATQSVAVLAGLVTPGLEQPLRLQLNFLALCAWLVGIALYSWLATLLLYRAMFLKLARTDLTPGWWITMGAMAISTLAGAQLVIDAADAPMLAGLLPFLRAVSVLCWAVGTWWLPLLLLLHVWRHARGHVPLRYDFGQWTAVFPLGMYSMASARLGSALGLGLLHRVGTAFFWIALAAWLATAAGMVRSSLPSARRAPAARHR